MCACISIETHVQYILDWQHQFYPVFNITISRIFFSFNRQYSIIDGNKFRIPRTTYFFRTIPEIEERTELCLNS